MLWLSFVASFDLCSICYLWVSISVDLAGVFVNFSSLFFFLWVILVVVGVQCLVLGIAYLCGLVLFHFSSSWLVLECSLYYYLVTFILLVLFFILGLVFPFLHHLYPLWVINNCCLLLCLEVFCYFISYFIALFRGSWFDLGGSAPTIGGIWSWFLGVITSLTFGSVLGMVYGGGCWLFNGIVLWIFEAFVSYFCVRVVFILVPSVGCWIFFCGC